MRAPSFCGAWAKPSLSVVPAVSPPQAVTVSNTVAAHPAGDATRFLPGALFRLDEDSVTVMSDSTGLWVPRAGGGWREEGGDAGPSRVGVGRLKAAGLLSTWKKLAALSRGSSRGRTAFL